MIFLKVHTFFNNKNILKIIINMIINQKKQKVMKTSYLEILVIF